MTAPAAVTALPPADDAWRRKVREFAHTTVEPCVREMDEQARLDPLLCKELFAAGLMGVEVPEIYGGSGADLFAVVLTIEELAAVDPAVAVFVDVQNALVVSALLRHGSGDQRRRYLPALATGTVGAFALSEESSGSDAFALTTVAQPDGDGFVLSGHKKWITNAAEAGVFLVLATVPGVGISAFLVDRDTAGLDVGTPISKLGVRASSTCEVGLDGVRVGRRNLLGKEGLGHMLAMRCLDIGKLGIAAQLVGLASGALRHAVAFAEQRQQFGHPIAAYQGVRFPLADVAAEIEAARVLLYNTTRLAQQDADAAEVMRMAAITKYLASEVAEKAASVAVDVYGGRGFGTADPVEKLYRDAKVGKIYEGTSNMQLRTIAAGMIRGSERSADRAEGGRSG